MANLRQFTVKCLTCGLDIPIIQNCVKCDLNKVLCLGSEAPPCIPEPSFCSTSCEFNAYYQNDWDSYD
jgi:hypothetical protein